MQTDMRPVSGPDIVLQSPMRGWYPRLRHAIDLSATAVLLVATAPFMLLAAVLVKLTSRGPVFYSQTRSGLDGQPFLLFKIRSMYHDCERISGPRWSSGRDLRVTPVGRILRFAHIDELPQFWNVLRGEMSLIGPRPERPEFVYKLEKLLPRYRERLNIKPGLSGFAQVQLPSDSSIESVRQKLAYDLFYIESLSPWLDLRILVCTAFKMVGIPFSVLRRLFAMPNLEVVEEAYWRTVPTSKSAAHLQMQPV